MFLCSYTMANRYGKLVKIATERFYIQRILDARFKLVIFRGLKRMGGCIDELHFKTV